MVSAVKRCFAPSDVRFKGIVDGMIKCYVNEMVFHARPISKDLAVYALGGGENAILGTFRY